MCDSDTPSAGSMGSLFPQVMETKDMLYIVTEFAKNGEMFGKCPRPPPPLELSLK